MLKLHLLLTLIPMIAMARPCPFQNGESNKKYICNNSGQLIKEISYWKGTTNPNAIFTYANGKVKTYQFFTRQGEETSKANYYHQEDGTILKEHYHLKEQQMVLIEKYLYAPTPASQKRIDYLIKEWSFNDEDQAQYIDHYDLSQKDKKVALKREILNDQQEISEYYLFDYQQNKKVPSAFQRYSKDDKLIGSYNPNNFSASKLADAQGPTSNDKTLIAVIDSDFDLNHPLLKGKVWINPEEPIDGIDNDNNGWVDDAFGWNGARKSNNLLGLINFTEWGTPVSHGTHVASLAVEGRDDVAFIGFCHDFSRPSYIDRIAKEINDKKILFTNMSFSMGNSDSPLIAAILSASPEVIKAVNNLVENTPNTLHVIAAANAGTDIDLAPTYPASNEADNTLVVGAIDDDILNPLLLPSYQLTWFSNTGSHSVDVLAPGAHLLGAAHGGGMVTYSGTSMATPYALNHAVIEVHHANRKLNIYQIKEVIMKSVYINDLENPFPVRSGGIIYPQRATAVARLLADNPHLSIEQAVIEIRKNEALKLNGEEQSVEYFEKLKAFWKEQAI